MITDSMVSDLETFREELLHEMKCGETIEGLRVVEQSLGVKPHIQFAAEPAFGKNADDDAILKEDY
jgi:hypothetical protein